MNDFDQLQQILAPVLEIEHARDGLLCTRFHDGTRMSFLCGAGGSLNVIVIQRDPVPPLRVEAAASERQ